MLTKNWFAWQEIIGYAHYSNTYPVSPSFKQTDGRTFSFNNASAVLSMSYANFGWLYSATLQKTGSRKYGIAFGSGGTPPTKDDYNIESAVNVTVQTPSLPRALVDNEWSGWLIPYVVSANEECTIREICLFAQVSDNTSPDSVSSRSVLMDRTLLDEPVHLNAGESTVVTYMLRFMH